MFSIGKEGLQSNAHGKTDTFKYGLNLMSVCPEKYDGWVGGLAA